jgi:pimeloyl-ACP methyl ester carboxylesterase
MNEKILKLLVLSIALFLFANGAMAQSLSDEIVANENTTESIREKASFQILVDKFNHLTSDRISKIKEGSRPFILSQNKKAPTVVMLHGLSDSPGSMREVSKVYFKLGYNVVTVLLRDHGLLEPYRHEIRSEVTLEDWREDIDQLMTIALQMSDSNQVALIGFSLGGVLAVDTADRYDWRISSLVLLAPLFKMNHSWAAPATKYLKHILYSTKKGIPEEPHFYPDIALNQTFQAYELTKHIDRMTKNPKFGLRNLPKFMFLTDLDLTIKNNSALETARRLNISENDIVIYENHEESTTVLHRDLPMRIINASKKENPRIDDLLERLENFLKSLE